MASKVSFSNPQDFLIHYRSKTVPTISTVAFLALGAVVIGVLAILATSSSNYHLAPFQNIGMKGAIAMTAVGGTLILSAAVAALLMLSGKQKHTNPGTGSITKPLAPVNVKPLELRRLEDWTTHSLTQEIMDERNAAAQANAKGLFYEKESLNELLACNYSRDHLPPKPSSWDKERWREKINNAALTCAKPAVFASDKQKDIKDQITILLLTGEELGALSLDTISQFTPFQKLALMQRMTIASQLHKAICSIFDPVKIGTLRAIIGMNVNEGEGAQQIKWLQKKGLLYLLRPMQIYYLLVEDKLSAQELFPIGNEIEQAYTQEILLTIMNINRNKVCEKVCGLPQEYARHLPPNYAEWYNSPQRTPFEKFKSLKPYLEI